MNKSEIAGRYTQNRLLFYFGLKVDVIALETDVFGKIAGK